MVQPGNCAARDGEILVYSFIHTFPVVHSIPAKAFYSIFFSTFSVKIAKITQNRS